MAGRHQEVGQMGAKTKTERTTLDQFVTEPDSTTEYDPDDGQCCAIADDTGERCPFGAIATTNVCGQHARKDDVSFIPGVDSKGGTFDADHEVIP